LPSDPDESEGRVTSLERTWEDRFGTTADESVSAMAVDSGGGIVVVGGTDGSLGGENAGSRDAFVRKYQSDGRVSWTRQFGGEGADAAVAVATDSNDDILMTGSVLGSLADAGTSVENYDDVFVRKYDGAGNVLWTREFGTPWDPSVSVPIGNDRAFAIAVDARRAVIVAGETMGSLAGSNAGFGDAFVRKYRSDGTESWTRQFGSDAADNIQGVGVDGDDNVIVAGSTLGALSDTSAGAYDAFVRKLDPDGNELWTRQFGTEGDEWVTSMAVDAEGAALILGYTDGSFDDPVSSRSFYDVFLAKYDSRGEQQWTRQFAAEVSNIAGQVSVGVEGDVLTSGYATGSLDGVSQGPAFVRSFDSLGDPLWTFQFDLDGAGGIKALALDGEGGFLVAGDVGDGDVLVTRFPLP
jgi:hypothetical protein